MTITSDVSTRQQSGNTAGVIAQRDYLPCRERCLSFMFQDWTAMDMCHANLPLCSLAFPCRVGHDLAAAAN